MAADLSLHTVEVRLARLLLDEATGDTLERPAWLTQAELAIRLGTVPNVLSRALRALSDAGLIRVDRRRIVILDRVELHRRAFAVEPEN
jgi:CRP-like cAMP-binding protein